VTPPLLGAWRLEQEGDLDVQGRVWVPGPGRIRIGRAVRLVGRRAAIELKAHEGGEIVIGDGVVIEDGTSIEATLSVRIGARARIGPFCKIIDNHFHKTVGDRYVRPEAVAIAIGEDAVVGPRAMILPGGGLGDRAWLGPGQVLALCLAAGDELPRPVVAT
jgi:acetyltransferase-like isoleucine patch superfamily enzyme